MLIYHFDTHTKIMKHYYQIQYSLCSKEQWESYYDETDHTITDYDQAISTLNELRKQYQEADSHYMKSHIFRLVKLQTTEEVLDI